MGGTILLADDSITIQKVVELTFASTDHEVVAVGGGKELLDRLPDLDPDVVLCDVVMPDMNGYDVCEHIKSDPATLHIPVVLLTGTFEPFDRDRAMAAGCDSIVTKPFESRDLVAVVGELMERGRAAREQAAAEDAAPFDGSMEAADVPALDFTRTGFDEMVPPSPEPAAAVPEEGIELSDSYVSAPFAVPSEAPAPAMAVEPEVAVGAEDLDGPWEFGAGGGGDPESAGEDAPFGELDEGEAASGEPDGALEDAAAEEPAAAFAAAPQDGGWTEEPDLDAGETAPEDGATESAGGEVLPGPGEAAAEETEIGEDGAGEPGFEESSSPGPAGEEPAGDVEPPAAPAAAVETPAAAAEAPAGSRELSDDEVERIAKRVVELAGPLLERVAWDVVPDMAEMLVRQRIRELEAAIDEES